MKVVHLGHRYSNKLGKTKLYDGSKFCLVADITIGLLGFLGN